MDQEPEKPSTPFIPPPPTLAKPAPMPPSPLDVARPAPTPSAVPPVNVHVKTGTTDTQEREDGLASFHTRAVAFAIDQGLALGVLLAFGMIHVSALGWLVGIAYMVTKDSLPFLGGRSVGKQAMKIQAVTLDGKSLAGDWQTGAIRNGVLMIPFFALLEMYMLLSREDKPDHGKRLGDEWAKTKVIVVKPPVPEGGEAEA